MGIVDTVRDTSVVGGTRDASSRDDECGRHRMAHLRTDVMERGGSFVADFNPFTRDVALWRAIQGERSWVQVRAALLHELVTLAPVIIPEGWSLAGEHLVTGQAASFGFNGSASNADPSSGDARRRLSELGVDEEDCVAVRKAVMRWNRRVSGPAVEFGAVDPSSRLGGSSDFANQTGAFLAKGWMENHSVRDYAAVLWEGFSGIRRRVAECLETADITDPDFPRKENFRRAALEVCDAGILLGRRYADAAEACAASCTSDDAGSPEGQRYEHMAETCRRVPEYPARTFFEAVQSLWFAHILTCGEDGINANSIGRLDQILYPWYSADIEAGRLTREEAVRIMEELACKLYLDYDVQAVVLGGIDAEGNDAVNELSYVILDASERVGFVRDLSVRLHGGSPRSFIRRACELVVRGGGIPFFFNDECFIPALTDRGIPTHDARDYAPIGCIELTIPGKANPHAVSGWFNAAKCLELTLFDGTDPVTGEQVGPRTGLLGDHVDLESLYTAYSRQVECMAARMVYHCNRGELAQREAGPLPYWSLLTDDCIGRGRDITDGGCLYNYHSIAFMGTANVADSLAALDRLVFRTNEIEPQVLLEALRANFEGYEPLRSRLLHEAPKYGNDSHEVDRLAARVAGDFIDLMDTMRSPLNGRYFVHLFTWRFNVVYGKTVGATPDGRHAGEPLAYSLSSQQGRDEEGVTAMLSSLSRLPHHRAGGASAAIIDLDPKLVEGDEGIDRLTHLVTTAFEMGVGQLQWNVTTAERLLQAQADPEHYGNIPVRVAGYSQMFRLIPRDIQDHIIARTKHDG